MKNRIAWIDSAKAIGIFLVVLGHLNIPQNIKVLIYSFHIPLFFFLSGVTFSNRETDFSYFSGKKFKSLIIPYISLNIITYAFWLIIGRHFGYDATLDVPWWKPLVGILYSNGIGTWLIHNAPMWFLTCLFATLCALFLLLKATKSNKSTLIALVTISILGYMLSLTNAPRLPWSLNVIPQALLFTGLGFLSKEVVNLKMGKMSRPAIILIAVLLVVTTSHYNGLIDLNVNHYGNYVLFLISALAGICAVVLIAQKLPQYEIISYIGKNTLILFSLHLMAVSIIKGVLLFIFRINLSILENSLLLNVLLSIATIGSLIPVCAIINNYTPWLMGRPASKSRTVIRSLQRGKR